MYGCMVVNVASLSNCAMLTGRNSLPLTKVIAWQRYLEMQDNGFRALHKVCLFPMAECSSITVMLSNNESHYYFDV